MRLLSYFGKDFGEPRLTAYQKLLQRKEFIFRAMNFLGYDTPEKKSNRVCAELLYPTFDQTVMAPLDQVSIQAFRLQEGLPKPRRYVISEMGTLGLACW